MRAHTSAYGSVAVAHLGNIVTEAKGDDPLTRVTFIVRDNIAAITARRTLAAGVGEHEGVAAISVTTLGRVADHLLARAGRTLPPVTSARLTALWRDELERDSGSFAPVATHPATVRALNRAHRELSGIDAPALAAVAASGTLGADLVRLHQRVAVRALDGRRDEAGVFRDAASLVEMEPETARDLGKVIVFLPDEFSPLELVFVRALDAASEVQVIVGITGDSAVDGVLWEQFGGAEGISSRFARSTSGSDASAEATGAKVASRIIHASDADDEVRAIVREIVALLADSAPAHRIATLYPKNVPYARLLRDHLAAAGIATNGPGVRPMRDRAIADAFLELLALDPDDLQRVTVFDWLGRAPVRTADGGTVPRTTWERISREAGVTGGDWTERLDEYLAGKRAHLDDSRQDPDASPGSIAYVERQIADTERLRGFIVELAETLRDGRSLRGWAQLGEWARRTFARYFGSPDSLTRLPEPEQRAATAIEITLLGLSELDGIGRAPSLDEVIEILDIDLDQRRPRVGRFGEGVFVGPVSAAASLDVTHLFVLGLSEDLYPGRQAADPLLPDAVRAATGELDTTRDRLRAMHRALLAAFAAAPNVTTSFPRGDLRRGSERLPSRWLMPSLRALTDEPQLEATRWFTASAPGLVSVESHWGGVARADRPSTEQEWRLRHQAGGGWLDDASVDAGTAITSARLSEAFTRFDGNLGGIPDLPDYADGARLISPTALEKYASCPHTFFVERVLNVSAIESPEDIVSIRPMDIGNIVHKVMDLLAVEYADRLPDYGEPWSADQRARMREIAAEVMAGYERRGLTGHPRLWARERQLLLADLEQLLDEDDRVRRERDARVVASELRFGMDGADPVLVEVDGGAIAMRGSADRIDQTRDGTLIVTDFKTGSASRFRDIEKGDPIVAGTKLQLPLYAYAARAAYGDQRIEAGYWFVGRKDRGTRIDVTLDDALAARYRSALGTLVRGIRSGRFIALPPAADDFAWVQCAYCNPDGVGYGHVRAASERKKTDAALADLFALLDPSVGSSADAASEGEL